MIKLIKCDLKNLYEDGLIIKIQYVNILAYIDNNYEKLFAEIKHMDVIDASDYIIEKFNIAG